MSSTFVVIALFPSQVQFGKDEVREFKRSKQELEAEAERELTLCFCLLLVHLGVKCRVALTPSVGLVLM